MLMLLLLLLLLVILVQSSSWVGGLVIHDLSVRASSCCSTSKMAAGLFCLFNQPPHLFTLLLSFFPALILGSSILHTVARLCLSLAPFNFSLPESFVTKPPSRPSKVAVLCLEKKRVSIHRPSDRNKRLFFFFG